MEPTKFKLTRDVTRDECLWLDADIAAGTIVYSYSGYTYGCIGPGGRAVTLERDGPFVELPRNALGDATIPSE
ncbi:hypothetical protein EN828_10290 [Mesorhizobium sp. M2D.F.Ca.ET.185.01.1.1]|uniref:hypothetical protein n=1 Tax=unclassified Mesorhizobium TaxID=325217 RepID=UPI000FC9A5C3|nr:MULTISPECIES: hypothetical protein [unclassified Mesorhizobium]TGV76279.1 hypothetical protein EN792_052920 [Mesorhizobium sp. M00.F.Ca.ET.149.01.1.1]TGP29083.1 hypothetical protein EN875_030180 [Mesorhizobium sp. M2D.F.Ca.ET.232.01.1.1]TGQ24599.1 hypothetical protein EN863_061305 [Mesorhizobium sp. M00.F.Ca.ET.220.01.1.1]TGQ89425.1 hypothetical protein EN849_09790 [Mesorhizobium sp. M2D.F.Ca.ET.206.01.1.1]TGS32590.1 hypothetical protein EN828_10290 [Mesorhizobium sp. M2D.F.Ca.ET.185.01.1.1